MRINTSLYPRVIQFDYQEGHLNRPYTLLAHIKLGGELSAPTIAVRVSLLTETLIDRQSMERLIIGYLIVIQYQIAFLDLPTTIQVDGLTLLIEESV